MKEDRNVKSNQGEASGIWLLSLFGQMWMRRVEGGRRALVVVCIEKDQLSHTGSASTVLLL